MTQNTCAKHIAEEEPAHPCVEQAVKGVGAQHRKGRPLGRRQGPYEGGW